MAPLRVARPPKKKHRKTPEEEEQHQQQRAAREAKLSEAELLLRAPFLKEDRGIAQSVIAASPKVQSQLYKAGKVESASCPFCRLDQNETHEHMYWACPAWASIRQQLIHAPTQDTSGWEPVEKVTGMPVVPDDEETLDSMLPAFSPTPPPRCKTGGECRRRFHREGR